MHSSEFLLRKRTAYLSKIPILLPIRGINSSKNRLRQELPDHKVNRIIRFLLNHTLDQIKSSLLQKSPIWILTAEEKIERVLHKKILTNITVFPDDGSSLNKALSDITRRHNYEKYLLIMPDLPGLTFKGLDKIAELSLIIPYVISSTYDDGTAISLLPGSFYQKRFFGKKSSQKILEYAYNNRYQISKLISNEFAIDLDSQSEWEHWKDFVESRIF